MINFKVGEARRRWHDRFTIAALGAIARADGTFLIIYDASNKVMPNHRTRVRDQVRIPTWLDISKYVEVCAGYPGVRFGLTYDVGQAHRQSPTRRKD